MRIIEFFHNILIKAKNSIAFYPALIVIIYIFLAVFLTIIEDFPSVQKIQSEGKQLFISSYSTARDIVTTIIAGTISLMVFSFTMVMVVLSQTSSNYSPRVVPGLISQRPHQVVLGIYLGTIIHSFITLHYIFPESSDLNLPKVSILLAEVSAVLSLIMFIYFIHSISKNIQISEIIESVRSRTMEGIKEITEEAHPSSHEINIDTSEWYTITSGTTGYYRNIKKSSLLNLCTSKNLIIEILTPKGTFLFENQPLFNINIKPEEKLVKTLRELFIFHQKEYENENYINGIKQLSEIAVKALSPAVNDPGTALRAIDNMAIVYKELLDIHPLSFYFDKKECVRVIQNTRPFYTLLNRYLGHIRIYAAKDVYVLLKLLEVVEKLLGCGSAKPHLATLRQFSKDLIDDAIQNISSDADKNLLMEKYRALPLSG